MNSVDRDRLWHSIVTAHELNAEDFGRNIMEEPERFYAAKDALLLGFNYFNKREGQSTGEEYWIKVRKMHQVRDSIQGIRENMFNEKKGE